MKHTYAKRISILTLFTFFTLALGSQWAFGQIISEDFSNYSILAGDCSTDFTIAPSTSFWRCGTANIATEDNNNFVELPFNVSPNLRGYINELKANTTYLLTYKARHNGAKHTKNLSFALRYRSNAKTNVDQTNLSLTDEYRKLGTISAFKNAFSDVNVNATNSAVLANTLTASWQEFNVIFTTDSDTSYILNFSRGKNDTLTSDSNVHIDDIEIREIAILKDNATDLDLHTNWENDNKPTSTSHALITNIPNNSTDRELTGKLSAYNLYVEQETAISSTGDLTVANNLHFAKNITIKSDASNHGNLKLTGSSETYDSKTITYELFTPITLRTGDFDASDLSNVDVKVGLITPPLNGMKFGQVWDANTDILTKWKYIDGGGNYKLFGPYEDGAYINYFSDGLTNGGDDKTNDGTLVVPGKGYRASLYEGEAPNQTNLTSNGVIKFTGTILTGNQTATVGSNSDGWDLIGNPYTTGLSLDEFVTDNNSKLHANATGITYWDNNTSAFVSKTANELSTTDIVIPPGQAFFIAPAASITSVDFKSSQQEIQTDAGFNRSTNNLEGFNLLLSNTASKSTKVYLNNTTTLGVDKGYEAAAIGLSVNGFGLYTVIADNSNANTPFTTQTIPATNLENTTLKLGINAGLGEHTLSLESINLPENVNVYLTDLANGSETLLNKHDYTFSVTNAPLEGADRFLISFQSEALSTGNNALEQLQIGAFQNSITVKGDLKNNTTLKVYDLQGRKVAQTALSNKNRQLTVNNSAGIYLVNLSNALGSKTQKVILK